MEQASPTLLELSTGSKTIADMPMLAAKKHADKVAVKYKEGDEWLELTFEAVGEIIRSVAKGLIAIGIEPGEKVAILSHTRPEWSFCDFGALSAGAAVAPVYQTNSPEECEYVIGHSDSKLVFVENSEQLAKIRAVRANLPKLEHVVVMAPDGDTDGAITLQELRDKGADVDDAVLDTRIENVTEDDICTIIYTSGTTGPPKGCLLTHGNYRAVLTMSETNDILPVGDQQMTYLFLPLAHSFALLIQLVSMDVGSGIAYWEGDPTKIVPNLMEVQPTAFPSVPRIFEKIYTMANSAVAQKPPAEQEQFKQAIELGFKVREMQRTGETVPPELLALFEQADEAVYKNVRNLFGGRLENAVTGAAPIAAEILKFFYACGVIVLEGYGMTETSTVSSVNHADDFRFGSIGRPLPGVEMMIAEDGEILIRGANIFQGYFKNPEATAETLVNGWLHTGDLGRIDDDGFVFITGRKKDIIITAGGKNLTPANFENAMKQNRWVSQAVMFGDRRPYPVALITLDPEELPALAAELDVEADMAKMADNPKVRAIVQAVVDEVNSKFAPVEQVKRFKILDHDLSQPTGELTPTLKVKRNVVNEKYADLFDKLYSDDDYS